MTEDKKNVKKERFSQMSARERRLFSAKKDE
jgi:hypothetical protein